MRVILHKLCIIKINLRITVKLFEKGTGVGVGRDEVKKREERERGKETPCVSLNFPSTFP